MQLHVATRKGLFDFDCGLVPRIVGRHFLGDNLSLSLHDARSGLRYAALDLGHFGVKLRRSADGGRTWEEIGVPSYPKRAEGESPEIGADGRPWIWDLKRIWSLEAGAGSQTGRLWCGTLPGGLFVSDDHGVSWRLVEGLWNHPDRIQWFGGGADHPGIHSICVDPRSPRTVRIAVSSGGVWRTDDDGASWRNTSAGMYALFMPPERREDPNIQDVHRLVQCRDEPDRLWVQHHNAVFTSRDGGTTWQDVPNVQPSVFGFAIAVDPACGNTAWTVPAVKDETRIPVDGKVVVSRSDDGGATWRVLRQGLPQQDAYDLVYRHSLDVAPDGKTLAFGSTTGSLWLTRDGGESWQALSEHLPPIHAVRFSAG